MRQDQHRRQFRRLGRTSTSLLALTAAGWVAGWASGAVAQSAPAAEPSTIDELVVTAQKREQNVNDVGMSISAVSGSDLVQRGVTGPADLSKVVPGFTFTQTQFDMPVYSLRGVGYYESSLSANPAVSVYVDEVPLPYPGMTRGALLDLQRVEVLKGPQGTLFGENSTGGAINYIAAKPTTDFQAGLTAGYARFDTVNLEGYVSGPLAPTLKARVALSTVQGGPWQQSQTRDEQLGRTNEFSGRLLLDWDVSEALTLKLNLNGWRDRSESQAPQDVGVFAAVPSVPLPASFLNAPLAPRDDQAADWDPGHNYARDSRFYQAALRGELKLGGGLQLTSISAWQRLDRRQFSEADGTPVQDLSLGTTGGITSFSQELRLSGGEGRLAHWVVGGNYQRDRIVDDQLVLLDQSTSAVIDLSAAGLGVFHYSDFVNRSRNAVDSGAVFASGELTVTDTLSLEAGVRYSHNRNRFEGCTADAGDGEVAATFVGLQTLGTLFGAHPTTTPVAGGCATIVDANYDVGDTTATLDEHNVSWRVNLNWRAADHLLVYGNISRGYKAGNFPTLSASASTQFTPVTQEELTAYEAGFKAQFPAQALQVTGAVYYYDYLNKQLRGRVSDPVFGQLEALVNIPRSHIWGLEAQATWRPVAGLTGNLGVSYVRTRIDGDFANYSQFGGPPQSFSGNEFPYSPRLQLNADAEYRHILRGEVYWFAGASVSYRSASKGGLENDPRLAIDAYALLDLRAGLESASRKWRLEVWGRNVTNTYYWVNVLKAQDDVIRYTGRPATWGGTLTYSF